MAVDRFVVLVPGTGRLSNTAGKEAISNCFTGGTIFVDLVMGFTFIKIQVSLRAEETLAAKEDFEQVMIEQGVHVRNYHGDNGIFISNAWKQYCGKRKQTYNFSGIGAHH